MLSLMLSEQSGFQIINLFFEVIMLSTAAIMVIISYLESKGRDNEKAIDLSRSLFRTGHAFNISALVIIIILAVLYTVFW